MSATSFRQSVDAQRGKDVSENAAEDIVTVIRGNAIGNEEQGLITAFQSVTGYLYDLERYANVVLIGPSSGGKTHLQDSVLKIIPPEVMYGDGEVTDFSDNAPLDDPEWNFALLAPLDEYDKISRAIREYMKSMAGEDGGYTKKRNTEDEDADSGYSPATVSSMSVPFQFLFAPEEKDEGLDNELDNRLIKVPIEDNKYIREAIGRKEFGHTQIEPQGLDNTYIFDAESEERGLRHHLTKLDDTFHDVTDDESEVIGRRGGLHTHIPEWVWYATKPLFNPASTHTNRVYGMVSNLMRGSAVWNHHSNPTVTTHNSELDEEVESIVVMPQDVANVLCCQQTLLGTTHLLDERKRDILDAVQATQGRGDGYGSSIRQIREWLRDNDKTVPSKSVLRRILKQDLAEDYYVRVHEGEGKNNADLYEYRTSGKLSPPRVEDLDTIAREQDGMDIDCPWVDPSDPFDGVCDPIRDQPFKETVEMLETELGAGESSVTSRGTVTDAADAMGNPDDTDGNQTLAEAGQHADDNGIELPSDPVVQAVAAMADDYLGAVGKTFTVDEDDDSVRTLEEAHLLGVVDPEDPVSEADLTGTIYDPTHPLWDHDDIDEERVTTREEARMNIEDAWVELREEGFVELDFAVDGFVSAQVIEEMTTEPPSEVV